MASSRLVLTVWAVLTEKDGRIVDLGSFSFGWHELMIGAGHEAAAEFWPQYIRGHAYLHLEKGGEAVIAAEAL